VHAKVLAPECVDFYYDDRVSDMPVFSAEDTLALFPSEHASTCEQLGKDKLRKFKRIVVIEGTWVKAAAAVKRANVEHLQHVRLKDYETSFWRYQRKGKEKDTSKLSSIEAIYYFYKEYIEIVEGSYDGRVDDLLYIFKGMKKLIEQKE
jgi:DTW domain-containing protein YfiP